MTPLTDVEKLALCCTLVGYFAGVLSCLVAAYLRATVDLLREERLAGHERKCGGCR